MDKQRARQLYELADRLSKLDVNTLSEEQRQQRSTMIAKLQEEVKTINEIDRRGFLKGMGAAAVAGKAGATDFTSPGTYRGSYPNVSYDDPRSNTRTVVGQAVNLYYLMKTFYPTDNKTSALLDSIKKFLKSHPENKDFVNTSFAEAGPTYEKWKQTDPDLYKTVVPRMITNYSSIKAKFDSLSEFNESVAQGVAENNLKEFAPDAGDGGEEETLHKYARMWYNGDLATQQQVEKILDRMGWEIGELESEEGGAFVIQAGDEHGDSYIGFTAVDLTEGITEGSPRVDSLVTDALRIIKGPEVSDAISALKTVLGDREYNGRRGHYNFYVKQVIDMYNQQGVTETKKPSPKLTPVEMKKTDPVSEEINTEAYERLQKVFAFKNYES